MAKRVVGIDDALLAEVRGAYGTTTLRATMDRSLREARDVERRREHLRLLEQGVSLVGDSEALAHAWS